MKRREFITLLGGAAAWPLAARAQQGDRVRRIGVPLSGDENDPVTKANVSAFTQALAELGWIDGSNLRIDLRGFAADMHMGVMDMSGFRMIPSGMGLMVPAHTPWRAMEFAFVRFGAAGAVEVSRHA